MLSDERLAEIRASVGGRSAQETVPGFVYRDDVTDLLAEIDRLKRERARIVVRLEEFESNSEEADAKCYACGCYYPGFEEPFFCQAHDPDMALVDIQAILSGVP